MKKKMVVLITSIFCFCFILTGVCIAQQNAKTQGEYAIELAAQLNLGAFSSPEAAVNALTAAGVTPPGGWNISAPVTGALVNQVNVLVIGAAQRNTITLTPAQAQNVVVLLSKTLSLPPPAVLPATSLAPVPTPGNTQPNNPPAPISQQTNSQPQQPASPSR